MPPEDVLTAEYTANGLKLELDKQDENNEEEMSDKTKEVP